MGWSKSNGRHGQSGAFSSRLTLAGSVPIEADPDRIGQVVTNYLTNALRYSAEDRPVEVGVQRGGAAGGRLGARSGARAATRGM